MEPISLLLSTVQLIDSAEFNLHEAAICADPSKEPVLQVAAMSTTFPVILAFGELLAGKRVSDSEVFHEFCKYMPWEWWLIPLTDEQPDDAAELLCNFRNAMVHALGVTAGVTLTPTRAGTGWARERGDRFAIMPARFVEAVKYAMYDIVDKNRDLDAAKLFMKWDRYPAVMTRRFDSAA